MRLSMSFIVSTSLICTLIALLVRRYLTRRLPFPPGPPALPILGNAGDIPAGHQWVEFARLSKIYGPVMHLSVLTHHIVVLDSLQAVTDLLDGRGNIYSDRPDFPMLGLMGWHWVMSIIRYGDRWRAQRRVVHAFFHEGESHQYRDTQAAANLAFLRALLAAPRGFMHHIRAVAAQSILSAVYGIDVAGEDDRWVKLADDSMRSITAAGLPGRYAVEWLPVLKFLPAWVPGCSFQRMARDSRALAARSLHEPLEYVREQMRAGTAGPSMAGSLLQDGLEGRPVPEDIIAESTAVVYFGGADTTVSIITAFVLCMVLHPEVQAAAQAELDRVLGPGPGRLPEFADRDALPYVNAVLLEVIRLYPVLPLGVPHRVMEDDEYLGMRIPKDAMILPNVWSILRDETLYERPDEFMPERHLRAGEEKAVPDPRGPLFGFGRRICPGRHFADNSAWLAVATVLACFRIARARDETGKEVVPSGELVSAAITCPKPFPCDILPRSEEARRLILDAAENQ